MASHINKAACRKTILKFAEMRHHNFERVGKDVFDELDIVCLNWMKNFVAGHPSKGKTLMIASKKRNKGKDAIDEAFG